MVVTISVPKKLVFKNGRRQLVDFNEVSRSDYDRAYNKRRQVEKPDYLKFYHGSQWQSIRKQVMTRDYNLCVRCGTKGYLVDHVIPSEDDWNNRLDIDNLETLCKSCHLLKTRSEWLKKHKGVNRAMKIHVLSGYPASGKSSYVASHVGEHDLVFDYDLIMSSLDGNMIKIMNSKHDSTSDDSASIQQSIHSSNIDLHEYVELIYEMLLRKLRSEFTFDNVWIIRTFPDERLENLLVTMNYDVEYLRLDTTRSDCMTRLTHMHRDTSHARVVMDKIDRLDVENKFNKYKLIKTKK
ncbi:HNH endonuclease [Companilactobacillus mishanensis]|uniref:HNH endonuclease n=1 Tax=Companilactobacillus mishanensis TaxID=2486008 RepID=UPI0030B86158